MNHLFPLHLLLLLPAALSSDHKEPFTGTMDHDGGFFLPDEPPAEPEFAEMEANVTGQLDGTVFLHCPVISSAGDRAISYPSISWVRRRDWHILTNGVLTYTSDERFTVLHKEGSYDWVLQIRHVQERDAGLYECQVSTKTGIIARKVHLEVVTPVAFIRGGDEYHIDSGSQLSLTCVIEQAPTRPQYVFWYHNHRMVNYDTQRGISVSTTFDDHPEKTQSRFNVLDAKPEDSGNYTCKPSNAGAASIQVFVSNSRVDKMEALHKQSSLVINTPGTASSSSSSASSSSSVVLNAAVNSLTWVFLTWRSISAWAARLTD